MMAQFRANIYIKEEGVKSTTKVEPCSIENSHLMVIDEANAENNISTTHDGTLSINNTNWAG